jgi:hypothetical protein
MLIFTKHVVSPQFFQEIQKCLLTFRDEESKWSIKFLELLGCERKLPNKLLSALLAAHRQRMIYEPSYRREEGERAGVTERLFWCGQERS